MCVFVARTAVAQRGASGPGRGADRGGRGSTLGGGLREETLKVTDKSRPMLEIVDMLQKRTGRPISYEDPVWIFEGFKELQPNGQTITRAAELNRTPGSLNPNNTARGGKAQDILSMVRASFETKITVDARTHLLPEPVDGSIQNVFDRILTDYGKQQLPGAYIAGNLGEFGWAVVPQAFRDREGRFVTPSRILDAGISFPSETRSTEATFELIARSVQNATGQRVVLSHQVSEATASKSATFEAVKFPRGQTVTIGANNETARRVIANALRTIQRGDARSQSDIPQRAWRLLYLHDRREYALDFVEVRQESYNASGQSTGTKPMTWRVPMALAPNDLASTLSPLNISPIAPAGSPLPAFGGPPVSAFGSVSGPIATPSAPVVGVISTPLVPNGALLSNGAIVDRNSLPASALASAAAAPAPAPSNPKTLVENVCSACHDFSLVSEKRLSREEWDRLLRSMVDRGAPLSRNEIGAALDYLATTYPAK
jgi:hypothetical protein